MEYLCFKLLLQITNICNRNIPRFHDANEKSLNAYRWIRMLDQFGSFFIVGILLAKDNGGNSFRKGGGILL